MERLARPNCVTAIHIQKQEVDSADNLTGPPGSQAPPDRRSYKQAGSPQVPESFLTWSGSVLQKIPRNKDLHCIYIA